jgi:flagellar L-ring protein precursor FlgH
MRRSVLLTVSGLALSLALGGCGTIKSTITGPKLTEINKAPLAASMTASPTVIASSIPANSSQAVIAAPGSSANSLWRPGARAFFIDQRANKPGDILTVVININDTAKLSNSTSAQRQNATNRSVKNALGLETLAAKILPKGYDPSNAINQSGSTSSAGTGSMNRQEQIQLTVAAVVTGVLPNGNLIIQGSQEVRTNGELRQLTVAGIVRPQDISSSNTIQHTQIAEARISYGGQGDLTRIQKTPWGQALAEQFSPF